VGVYETEHDDALAVAVVKVQPVDGPNVPVPLLVKPILPVGGLGEEDLSATVAVQVAAVPIVTGLGEH